ncbi:serine/threonine-protein kinase dst1-like, partial [Trifolium medium]|nr:serine/threonine-protein kinase dst1-like [Trifolium medium]
MFPKLEKARQVRASMALQVQTLAPAAAGDQEPMLASILNDEYGDTVPSRPQNISVEEAAYISSHGTMRKLQKVDEADNSE